MQQSAFYADAEGSNAAAPNPSAADQVADVLTHLAPLGLLGQIDILQAALDCAKALRAVGEAAGAGTWVSPEIPAGTN